MSTPEETKPTTFEFNLDKTVKIERTIPDDLPLLYSDGMVVKNQDGLFILYFLQNRAPITVTTEEMNALETVEARCVAQLVITPTQMRKNLEALNKNMAKFDKAMEDVVEQLRSTPDNE